MRGIWMVGLVGLLAACGDSGPTEAELAKAKAEKNCSKVYSSMTKVYKDELHKKGVSGVEFSPKDGFVEKCVEVGFSEEEAKCLDPNLGGTEECTKLLDAKKDDVKKLKEYLLKPMTDKSKGGEEKKKE